MALEKYYYNFCFCVNRTGIITSCSFIYFPYLLLNFTYFTRFFVVVKTIVFIRCIDRHSTFATSEKKTIIVILNK